MRSASRSFIAVTVAYTLVVLVEGIGLWMRKTWAEWLTVIFTASLIPFELWELIKRPPGHRSADLRDVLRQSADRRLPGVVHPPAAEGTPAALRSCSHQLQICRLRLRKDLLQLRGVSPHIERNRPPSTAR